MLQSLRFQLIKANINENREELIEAIPPLDKEYGMFLKNIKFKLLLYAIF